MNYLDKLITIIEFHRKKQKIKKLKTIGALAVLGVAIGGAATVIFAHGCCNKMGNIVIRNVEDIDDDVNKNRGNDENINRDEIKETLGKAGEESLGDVGFAMENALEDLEDENDDEIK
jgi:gas vesicle protein